MSTVVGSAEFELRATAKKLKADIDRAQRETKQAADRIANDFETSARKSTAAWNRSATQWARDVRKAEREIKASAGEMKTALASAAGALAGAFTVQAATELADGYTRTTNALKVAGLEGEALAQVLDALYASANKNGAPIEALSTLYSRASQSAADLGASQSDLLRFSDGVATALRVQGVSAIEAQGALLQLSQALSGGIVRAEEFNSVNEGARPILAAVAAGSDRFKGSVTALKTAVNEGTVSSQEFFQAFLRGMGELETKAGKAPLTIAGALQVLQNQLQRFVGEAATTSGAAEALALGIQKFGENIPTVANALAVLAVVLAGRYTAAVLVGTAANVAYTASLIAKTAAIYGVSRAAATGAVALRGLSGAMAFFGGPIGLAITGVALAVWALYEASKATATAQKEYSASAEAATTAAQAYAAAAGEAAGASGKERDAALRNAAAKKEEARQSLETAKAKLADAAASLAVARADAARLRQMRADPMNADWRTNSALGQGQNDAEAKAAQAEANVKAAEAGIASATKVIADADRILKAGTTPPAAPTGQAASGQQQSKEEIAAARERIALEDQLAIAEAAGDQARIEALQTQLDLLQLIARYRQAGYSQSDAEQMALDQLRREGQAKRDSRPPKAVEVDQNPTGFTPTGDYIPGGGAVVGGRILSQEDLARAKEEFRDTFSSGIMAALKDGKEGFARWIQQGAEQGLEKALNRLADTLFDLFAQAMQQGGGQSGGGWLSALGSVFSGGTPSIFGGGHAYGGETMAGRSYLVGERGPEIFKAGVSGMIMPTPKLAMAGAGSTGRGQVLVRVQSDDDKFRAFVADVAGPIAAKGDAAVLGAGLADKQRSARKQQYRARR